MVSVRPESSGSRGDPQSPPRVRWPLVAVRSRASCGPLWLPSALCPWLCCREAVVSRDSVLSLGGLRVSPGAEFSTEENSWPKQRPPRCPVVSVAAVFWCLVADLGRQGGRWGSLPSHPAKDICDCPRACAWPCLLVVVGLEERELCVSVFVRMCACCHAAILLPLCTPLPGGPVLAANAVWGWAMQPVPTSELRPHFCSAWFFFSSALLFLRAQDCRNLGNLPLDSVSHWGEQAIY